jgi:hypothetical protein
MSVVGEVIPNEIMLTIKSSDSKAALAFNALAACLDFSRSLLFSSRRF